MPPIYGVAPLEPQLGTCLAQPRFQTSLVTGFSIVAPVMAAVGFYGIYRVRASKKIRLR